MSRRRFILAVCLLTSVCFLGASPAQATLVFERPNGSKIHFEDSPRAWCGPWAEDVLRPSIHVAARNAKRGWELSAVRRDVKVGRPLEFPNDFVWSKPRGAQLFAAAGQVEVSSAEEESAGSIVFSRANCSLGGVAEFSVDAVLGSEFFGGDLVKVSGTYRGRVTKPPYHYSRR